MVKVCVILVTYNGDKWLRRSLNSLLNSTIELNIIIVDNGSSDETINITKKEYNYKNIHLVQTKENVGFGEGNNIGIKLGQDSNADYFFLLNQDASISPNTIEEMIKIHKTNYDFGLLSPIHLNGSGEKLDFLFERYIAPVKDKLINESEVKILEVPFVNAAAWLIPASTIDRVGFFESKFFMYSEDNNYVDRLLYHNLKLGVCTNCFIFHDREQTTKTPSEKNYLNRKKSTYYRLLFNPRLNIIISFILGNIYLYFHAIKKVLQCKSDLAIKLIALSISFKKTKNVRHEY